MSRRFGPEVAGVLLAVALAAALLTYVVAKSGGVIWRMRNVSQVEEYKDLDFLVLHRPHVTYLLDRRYHLCFATRKPDFQDLVQFTCTDKLLETDPKALKRAVKGRPTALIPVGARADDAADARVARERRRP